MDIITIGIHEEKRERANGVKGTFRIRGESIQGLDAGNEKLQQQIARRQGQIDKIMSMLVAHEVPGTRYIDTEPSDHPVKKKNKSLVHFSFHFFNTFATLREWLISSVLASSGIA